MIELELTQGQYAKVDDDDYPELSKYNWQASWSNITNSYYAVRTEGKRPSKGKVYMHRQVMKTPISLVCDHINHDTLDNTKSNLRNITRSQNQMNRRTSHRSSTGYKCIYPSGHKFIVRVRKNGAWVYSKVFSTIADAIEARDAVFDLQQGDFRYSIDMKVGSNA